MKLNKLKISSIIFSLLLFAFGAFFIFSLVSCIITNYHFTFSLDSASISNFLRLFETPIQVGTAFFATFAVWLTIERMKQTNEQIKELTKNNWFNNYFKHRDEFIKEFLHNKFFIQIDELSTRDINSEIRLLYNLFYYPSPNTFKPSINETAKNQINLFLENVTKSDLDKENYNLENSNKDELAKISELNFFQVKSLLTSVHSKLIPEMRKIAKDSNEDLGNLMTKFIYLDEFYWSGLLYQSLLQFDGSTKRVWDNFDINFITFREPLYYENARTNIKRAT